MFANGAHVLWGEGIHGATGIAGGTTGIGGKATRGYGWESNTTASWSDGCRIGGRHDSVGREKSMPPIQQGHGLRGRADVVSMHESLDSREVE